jgi:leukotriene-A4 hydrolase
VKGALFLKSLERTFGRPRFDNFLKDYFSHFRFQSITTEEEVNYLRQNLLRRYPAVTVSENFLSEWINKPGLPDSPPTATSELLDKIGEQAKDWSAGTLSHFRTRAWTAHEWLYFLRMLPSELGAERMKELDDAFHLPETRNAEILHQWLLMAILNSYKPACDRLERFLSAVGRRIYIKPLYEEQVKTEAGKQFAQAIHRRVRSSYHPISQATTDKIVGVS